MSDPRQTAEQPGLAGAPADGAGEPEPQAQSPRSPTPVPAVEPGDGSGSSGGEEGALSREADEDALKGDVDELVAVAAQRDEYLALAQRAQADFENYRKRVAKESVAAQQRGTVRLAEELLPALDNLDRALCQAEAAEGGDGCEDPVLEGFRLVRSELHAALARVGIESFSPEGSSFDPAEHEAMAQRQLDGVERGTVVEVYQPGYRLGESIIRPARVVVAA